MLKCTQSIENPLIHQLQLLLACHYCHHAFIRAHAVCCAVLSQGEMLDNIEKQVHRSVDYVSTGTDFLSVSVECLMVRDGVPQLLLHTLMAAQRVVCMSKNVWNWPNKLQYWRPAKRSCAWITCFLKLGRGVCCSAVAALLA